MISYISMLCSTLILGVLSQAYGRLIVFKNHCRTITKSFNIAQ
uniref:Uncharacterized protein n=1 Tax=Lepeophtheirus salmonis TaxID=72036 RepID=A0A0K2SX90_LEPSM